MAGFEQQFQPRNDVAQPNDNNVRLELHAEAASTAGPGARTTKFADGTVVQEDGQGHVVHIERTNGTSVDLGYTGNLLDTLIERKGNQSWTWKRQNGTDFWHSMDNIGSTLLHMSVNSRGQETYESPNASLWTINGDGSSHYRLQDGTSGDENANGKLTDLTRPNGSELIAGYGKNGLDHLTEMSKQHRVDWSKEPSGAWVSPQSSSIRLSLSAGIQGHEAFVEVKGGRVEAIDYLDGYSRRFGYRHDQITSVKEHSANGDATWSRVGNGDVWKSGNYSEIRRHVSVDRDGNYSYIDKSGNLHLYRFDDTEALLSGSDATVNPAVEAAVQQLQLTASKQISDADDLAKFKHDISEFIRRAPASEVSAGSMLAALSDVQELLDAAPAGAKITGDDRRQLAEEVLHHIADPRTSNQNPFGTCAATTAQTVIADRAPDKFTALIRQIADTGKFVTTSGLVVQLPPDQYLKDFNSKEYQPYDDSGSRSYAGQLFQLVASNAALMSEGKGLRYFEEKPTAPLDTGERLVDTKSGASQNWDGLNGSDIQAIGTEVAGLKIPVWYQNTDFSDAQTLGDLIRANEKSGSLPAVLFVMPKDQPFYGLTGHPLLGKDAPGGHFVTVWNINHANDVLVGNQWGISSDWEGLHRISLSQLYAGSIR